METMSKTNRSERVSTSGYTLVEMILVTVVLGIVGMASSYVVLESMRAYARVAPHVDASYQGRLATERIQRDVRNLADTASIAAFTATDFSFVVSSGESVSYSYAGADLLRNGSPVAEVVSSCAFSYLSRSGSPALVPEDLHLVDVRLALASADGDLQASITVFPRRLE